MKTIRWAHEIKARLPRLFTHSDYWIIPVYKRGNEYSSRWPSTGSFDHFFLPIMHLILLNSSDTEVHRLP